MKCTSAIRQLAYDNTPDAFDEYLQMALEGVEKIYEAHENIHGFLGILENQKMVFDDWNDMHANPSRNMQRTWIERCDVQHRKAKEIQDKEVHLRLQRNLMEHIWQNHEDEEE
ncbi:hypothetical protein Tco_0864192 [Tanacetum coccineum]